LCGPQGNVVLKIHKPVEEVFAGDGEVLEVMALLEGLQAALELDIRNVKVLTDHKTLHNHVCHVSRVARKRDCHKLTIENSLIELSMFLVAVAFGDDAFVCLGIRIFDISAARFC